MSNAYDILRATGKDPTPANIIALVEAQQATSANASLAIAQAAVKNAEGSTPVSAATANELKYYGSVVSKGSAFVPGGVDTTFTADKGYLPPGGDLGTDTGAESSILPFLIAGGILLALI